MNPKILFLRHLLGCKNKCILKVSGCSMFPTIVDGEEIIITAYNEEIINKGSIILYAKNEQHLTVHRVIDIVYISEKRFYCKTKGDNNEMLDPYVVFNHEIFGIVELKEGDVKYD